MPLAEHFGERGDGVFQTTGGVNKQVTEVYRHE